MFSIPIGFEKINRARVFKWDLLKWPNSVVTMDTAAVLQSRQRHTFFVQHHLKDYL
jgi:hypothetical protein